MTTSITGHQRDMEDFGISQTEQGAVFDEVVEALLAWERYMDTKNPITVRQSARHKASCITQAVLAKLRK